MAVKRTCLAGLLASALAGCSPLPGVVEAPLSDALGQVGRDVQVERVLDGDTIVVTGDERVRLLTIDAPELNSRSAGPPDCGAEAAQDALEALLPPGTPVVLNGLKGEPSTDRYGRTLSNVHVWRGDHLVNVSLWLAGQGWARVYHDYRTADTAAAVPLQVEAEAADRGVWRMC